MLELLNKFYHELLFFSIHRL